MNKTNTNVKKLVKIKVLDQTGHTTLEQFIDDAISSAVTMKFTHGKNIHVRSDNGIVPFELQASDITDTEGLLKDTVRFHKILEQYDEPVIFVTGALAGGMI